MAAPLSSIDFTSVLIVPENEIAPHLYTPFSESNLNAI